MNIQFFGGLDINKLYETVSPEDHWRQFLVQAEAVRLTIQQGGSRQLSKKPTTGSSYFVRSSRQQVGLQADSWTVISSSSISKGLGERISISACQPCLLTQGLPNQLHSVLAGQDTRTECIFGCSGLLSRRVSFGLFWFANRHSPSLPPAWASRLGQLLIINAPASFTMIWSVAKRWLDQRTVDKVDILGTDYLPRVLELIDEENLPTILGGKCTCEEYGGCALSSQGPWLEGRVGWGPNSKANGQLEKPADGKPGAGRLQPSIQVVAV